jgi:hypothetical protein
VGRLAGRGIDGSAASVLLSGHERGRSQDRAAGSIQQNGDSGKGMSRCTPGSPLRRGPGAKGDRDAQSVGPDRRPCPPLRRQTVHPRARTGTVRDLFLLLSSVCLRAAGRAPLALARSTPDPQVRERQRQRHVFSSGFVLGVTEYARDGRNGGESALPDRPTVGAGSAARGALVRNSGPLAASASPVATRASPRPATKQSLTGATS